MVIAYVFFMPDSDAKRFDKKGLLMYNEAELLNGFNRSLHFPRERKLIYV